MCINPHVHPSGLRTPCHQCWQCKENRVNDWIGRCIAEKETSVTTMVATLTYGGGDRPETRFLRKSDITAYIKAIRNGGHLVRYFAVGEYGSKKGRAHWHIVLFWQSKMPFRALRENINDEWWPHGYSFWDNADGASIRYVMKYINKESDDQAQLRSMAMSRKPLLGRKYFEQLAERYIASGLSPQRPFYKFRDVLDKHGKCIEFYMPPLVAKQFCEIYIAKHLQQKPGQHWPPSDLVDKYHDKMAAYVPPIHRTVYNRRDAPWMAAPYGAKECFDEKLNAYYCVIDGERLFWSFDERGQRQWQRKIVTETQAEKFAAEYERRVECGRLQGGTIPPRTAERSR